MKKYTHFLAVITAVFLCNISLVSAQCAGQLVCTGNLPVLDFCDVTKNDAFAWNSDFLWDHLNSSHDMPEAAVDLSFTLPDSCANARVDFVLLLNTDVLSRRLDRNTLLPTGEFVINTPTGQYKAAFDSRNVPEAEKYRFTVSTTRQGARTVARLRWNTAAKPEELLIPQLPNGQHTIIWQVQYGDAPVQECRQQFVVRDCEAPTLTCQPSAMASWFDPYTPKGLVSAYEFLGNAADNTTPKNSLTYSLRKVGSGTGYPLDMQGEPVNRLAWSCADIAANQPVELWVRDKAGNTNSCRSTVEMRNGAAICKIDTTCIKALDHCTNKPIRGVQFELNGVVPNGGSPFSTKTDTNGCFNVRLPFASSYVLTPFKNDDNWLQNINTYDLVLMARHINGVQPLNTPYKLIATDANKSGSVTTFDVLQFQQLLLGKIAELPGNTTWRFIDRSFVFANMQNPFTAAFPEVKSLADFHANMLSNDFYGIKIGDVSCGTTAPSGPAAFLTIRDQQLRAGQTVSVPVSVTAAAQWRGAQWALQIDTARFELLEASRGDLDRLAIFQPNARTARFIWFTGAEQGETLSAGQRLFSVRVRAKVAGRLSQGISLSKEALSPEVYPNTGAAVQPLQLVFQNRPPIIVVSGPGGGGNAGLAGIATPNPTIAGATIAMDIPEASAFRVELFDLTGRLLYNQTLTLERGAQQIDIPAESMPQPGLYLWRVARTDGSALAQGKLARLAER